MLNRITSALFTVALLISVPARGSDLVKPGGGALAQIVDGAGTQTTITLINLDPSTAPYTLYFYDDNGNALPLSTTAGPPSAVLTGTLGAGASTIIQTNGGGQAYVQGWALVVTNNTIAGTAVFGAHWGNLLVEASCPLDTGVNYKFGLPFDNTTSAIGVALANTYQSSPLTVTVTVNDLNGNPILTDTLTLRGNGHTSFMLTTKYPQLANQKGFVTFSGSYYMNALGLRATSTTFTSITPIVASGW